MPPDDENRIGLDLKAPDGIAFYFSLDIESAKHIVETLSEQISINQPDFEKAVVDAVIKNLNRTGHLRPLIIQMTLDALNK